MSYKESVDQSEGWVAKLGGGTAGLTEGLNTGSRDKATKMRPWCFRDEADLFCVPHNVTLV